MIRQRLGDILIAKGWITEKQLWQALILQRLCKMPLGDILTGEGLIKPLQLRDALALQQDMPTVDLLRSPPDAHVLDPHHRKEYLRLGLLPWRKDEGIWHIAITRNDAATHRWIRQQYGEKSRLLLTSPMDIRRSVAAHFVASDSLDACFGLATASPEKSAWHRSKGAMRAARWLLFAFLIALCVLLPEAVLLFVMLLLQAVYFLTLGFKALAFTIGLQAPALPEPPPLRDDELPIYTVLIPLHHEAQTIPRLLTALRAMDYPRTKLDIKLLVESDDESTYQAIVAQAPEPYFDIVRIPVSEPRTKPKALNYALRFARGAMVAVFDAEDKPATDQLRKAAAFFANHDNLTLCLQARLNYDNYNKNMLTRLFSIEYAVWFDVMLPGLQRLGVPLPLGGTSNHIPRTVVEALHAWDPHNVTEDADLGLRIAVAGGRSQMLDSLTLEEATHQPMAWIKQRSRWIKGYMQTYLVAMRRPDDLLARTGWFGFIGVQLFIGAPPLIFLCGPVLWCLSGLWFFRFLPLEPMPLLDMLMILSIGNLLMGGLLHLLQAVVVVRRSRWEKMRWAVALFPFYWVMHSIASFRALWQFFTRPYYWDKTPHGVDASLNHK